MARLRRADRPREAPARRPARVGSQRAAKVAVGQGTALDRRGPLRAASVGVRELRQNLSVYLDVVKHGEALNVTEHGHVVAVLCPVPGAASALDLLIARGLVRPATRALERWPLPRPLAAGQPPLSRVLEDMREDERS